TDGEGGAIAQAHGTGPVLGEDADLVGGVGQGEIAVTAEAERTGDKGGALGGIACGQEDEAVGADVEGSVDRHISCGDETQGIGEGGGVDGDVPGGGVADDDF